MEKKQAQNIDEYLQDFPEKTREILQIVRKTIQNAAPQATEAIKYAIPTFVLNSKNLVHFAAYKNHIGFYAMPAGNAAFQEALSGYKQGKGSVQFPLDQDMPLELITQMVQYKVELHA